MILLETERLLFRKHEPSDEAAFVQMQMDPEFRRNVGGRVLPPDQAVQRFRSRYLRKPDGSFGLWATILKEENTYIGYCGLAGDRAEPSLAYYIARPYWGRGLATEAARAFVDFGFAKLKLPRIVASAEKGHSASDRILEKLGFALEREENVGTAARVICHYALSLRV
ncbi:MAG TPA: GNAT family N-acetyltransferase [Candidatus Rubrimentiphilum sp.]|nr:GNAT family N-acetyltransferase [Candidatus Rubrimentiphilum sp.]